MAKGPPTSLTPIASPTMTNNKKRVILCLCSCGNEKYIDLKNYKSGHAKSCGCSRRRPRKDPSRIIPIDQETCQIELHGKYADLTCIIDSKDVEKVKGLRWRGMRHKTTYYAYIGRDKQKLFLHQLIAGIVDGYVIDHINHNGLDNRKSNLRHCTQQQNTFNGRSAKGSSSKFIGVSYVRKNQCWVSYLKKNGRIIHRQQHATEEEAVKARDTAAKQYFGDFANLNCSNP